MKVHAIQTGFVRIKTAQVEGRGHGLSRRLAIFADSSWTDWLPTYAWAIDCSEGVIVVDSGQGAHLLQSGKSLHPYVRWEVAFRIEPEQEIGPQLRAPWARAMSNGSFSLICTWITTAGWRISRTAKFWWRRVN